MESCVLAKKNKMPLWMKILIGLAIGVLIGFLAPDFGKPLKPFGDAFIKAIKMIVIPLVFAAVTLGIAKMGADLKQLGRLGVLAFTWFYVATGISIVLGLLLNQTFHPAQGVLLEATGKLPDNLTTHIDWVKFFLDIIPDNVIMAAANQKIIPVLFFAVCFGLCVGAIGEKGKPIISFLDSVMEEIGRAHV